MMKKILAVGVFFVFIVMFSSICTYAQDAIIGTWITVADKGADKGKNTSHVEIFEKNGLYYGKIVKLLLEPADELCTKCKGDLKNTPVVGMVILKGLKKTGKIDKSLGMEYDSGTIMDPKDGETYRSKAWVKGDVLTMRGFVGISLLGRSANWMRLNKQ